MSKPIEKIQHTLAPLKQEIVDHKAYEAIRTIEDLRVFMRYHVYAVWDFMSLLKALQIDLTCTTLPWFPKGSGSTRSLINEIVAGEESDVDFYGHKKSHFEMYIDAMKQCGADTTEIDAFIIGLQSGQSLDQAFDTAKTPLEARNFVRFTFSLINSDKSHNKAAAFTFGREDLIPGMFHAIVDDLNRKFPGQLSLFKYYLDRHIEMDGDHHSHLALEMTRELCGEDALHWTEAENASKAALQQRVNLWNGVYQQITSGIAVDASFA